MPRPGDSDFLTRTTLNIETSLTAVLVAQVTYALQHVPGVLLAEVNTAGARVVVAHDAAVPAASLVAAAAGAGVRAKVVAAPRASAAAVSSRLGPAQIRYLVTLATLAFVSLALVDVFIPSSAERRYASIVISAFWVFFFAQVILKRRS
jgi:hypothetical protein